jgi:hypothetical protein
MRAKFTSGRAQRDRLSSKKYSAGWQANPARNMIHARRPARDWHCQHRRGNMGEHPGGRALLTRPRLSADGAGSEPPKGPVVGPRANALPGREPRTDHLDHTQSGAAGDTRQGGRHPARLRSSAQPARSCSPECMRPGQTTLPHPVMDVQPFAVRPDPQGGAGKPFPEQLGRQQHCGNVSSIPCEASLTPTAIDDVESQVEHSTRRHLAR